VGPIQDKSEKMGEDTSKRQKPTLVRKGGGDDSTVDKRRECQSWGEKRVENLQNVKETKS